MIFLDAFDFRAEDKKSTKQLVDGIDDLQPLPPVDINDRVS